MHVPAVIPRI